MIDRETDLGAVVKRAAQAVPLPKRFYTAATVGAHADGFAVLLDGKTVRTPGKAALVVPREGLAKELAAEWAAQTKVIDPKLMPLTRLINSAIDGVAGKEAEVAADAAKYAGSDLLCYRADGPEALVALQAKHWDPLLRWAEISFDCRFRTATGIVHVDQPAGTAERIAGALAAMPAFALAGVHSMTTLTGSVLLAMAVARKKVDAQGAWAAAHVDEDFQIAQWGEDDEATARRAFRWQDMDAAARLVAWF
jgi:chaperone required for assembly of F1-ATPase